MALRKHNYKIVWKDIFEKSDIWPIKIVKSILKRNKKYIIFRNGATPSGILHIGNANEAIRNFLVALCIKEYTNNFLLVFSLDEEDPFSKVPNFILDEKGSRVRVSTKMRDQLEKYLGYPLYEVPDPYNCHKSYTEHFYSFFFEDLRNLGIEIDDIDNLQFGSLKIYVYKKSKFYKENKKIIKKILENADKISAILRKYKERFIVKYPAHVVCRKCNRLLGEILEFNGNYIEYECKDREIKRNIVKGCGYKEKISYDDAEIKLNWIPEWVVLDWFFWILNYGENILIVEPMGKDHYIGSLPPAKELLKEVAKIFDKNVSENNFLWYMYEFFLVNGEKMSGSKGNVYTIRDLLSIWEKEIVIYFYVRNLTKQVNIDMKNAFSVVNEFDNLEKNAFQILNKIKSGELNEKELTKDDSNMLTTYYLSMLGKIPETRPRRLNYITAAVTGILYNNDKTLIKKMLEEQMNLEYWEIEMNINRILRAAYWLKNFAPSILKEKYMIKIQDKKIDIELDDIERKIIEDIVNYLESTVIWDPDKIYNDVSEIINNYIPPIKENKERRRQVFAKLYKILTGKDSGPKIGTLFFAAGKKSIDILKMYLRN